MSNPWYNVVVKAYKDGYSDGVKSTDPENSDKLRSAFDLFEMMCRCFVWMGHIEYLTLNKLVEMTGVSKFCIIKNLEQLEAEGLVEPVKAETEDYGDDILNHIGWALTSEAYDTDIFTDLMEEYCWSLIPENRENYLDTI